MVKINYKSDFIIKERPKTVALEVPFVFSYYVFDNKKYVASFDGNTYVNCERKEDGSLDVIFNSPGFGVGRLKVERKYSVDDKAFVDGVYDIVTVDDTDVFITSGKTFETYIETLVVPPYIKGDKGDPMTWSGMTEGEQSELVQEVMAATQEAQLVEQVTGNEKISVSDGSGVPKAITTEQIKNYIEESKESSSLEFVDLGLPSGTLWATRNIGAEKPEDSGLFFAWGETEGYNVSYTEEGGQIVSTTIKDADGNLTERKFTFADYKWSNGAYNRLAKYNTNSSYGVVDNLTRLLTDDDAAYAVNNTYRIPSVADFEELIQYTTFSKVSIGSKKCGMFTAANGNYVIFPITGTVFDQISSVNSAVYYPTCEIYPSNPSTCKAMLISDYSELPLTDFNSRCTGLPVRAVKSKETGGGTYDDTEIKAQIKENADNIVANKADADAKLSELGRKIEGKQNVLKSGENIKTINGESILGSGNIVIEGGTSTGTVTGVKGDSETSFRKGEVNITASNIGLGNVDNTADSEKSVKYATASGTSEKSTSDANGNVITETYATKSELSQINIEIAQAKNDASIAKNAVATLEGLANANEAMQTLAEQVLQIEENKQKLSELEEDIEELNNTITGGSPYEDITWVKGSTLNEYGSIYSPGNGEICRTEPIWCEVGDSLIFGKYSICNIGKRAGTSGGWSLVVKEKDITETVQQEYVIEEAAYYMIGTQTVGFEAYPPQRKRTVIGMAESIEILEEKVDSLVESIDVEYLNEQLYGNDYVTYPTINKGSYISSYGQVVSGQAQTVASTSAVYIKKGETAIMFGQGVNFCAIGFRTGSTGAYSVKAKSTNSEGFVEYRFTAFEDGEVVMSSNTVAFEYFKPRVYRIAAVTINEMRELIDRIDKEVNTDMLPITAPTRAKVLLGEGKKVLLYGDSLSSSLYHNDAYERLIKAYTGADVYAGGYPGYTTAQIASDANLQRIYDYDPDLIIFQCGGNETGADCGTFGAVSTQTLCEPTDITQDFKGDYMIQAIDHMLRKVKAHYYNIVERAGVELPITGSEQDKKDAINSLKKPYIAIWTPLPQKRSVETGPFSLPRNWLNKRNAVVEVCNLHGFHCIDVYAENGIDWSLEPLYQGEQFEKIFGIYTHDGVHPNPWGYEKICNVIAGSLF